MDKLSFFSVSYKKLKYFSWTWEWKSRVKIIEEEIKKFYLELGHIKLLRFEYSFNF